MARLRIAPLTLAALLIFSCSSSSAGQEAGPLRTTLSARAFQQGEVVRLDVTCSCQITGATATVFGRAVPLFPVPGSAAWRGLIGIDVTAAPGKYPVRIAADRTGEPALKTTSELVVAAKRFPTRRLTVEPRFVDPPPAEVARIQDEARRLETLFDISTPRILWQGTIQLPVSAEPSGSFGMRSVFNGQARSPHGGTDFPSPAGAPITAPAAGTIVLAEDLYFTGNTVVIDHGLGLYSLMAHLSKFEVKAGDTVTQGQVIGLVGATGRVTGPHLHWTVRLDGARVDPLSLVATATTRD
jgi:murein DD-endopeptidase MepM/ murein hydrolase activator NlpD